ncbi:hypothetical protein ABZP36_002077, partial [Zizania latifolia]
IRERSVTEAALDRVSTLVGSFKWFRKKEESTGPSCGTELGYCYCFAQHTR